MTGDTSHYGLYQSLALADGANLEDERLVAELELLGIRYLSRQTIEKATTVRPPDVLLADLVQQSSARVRSAVIAVLLTHPELAEAIPAALEHLGPVESQTLRFFYTAAVLLQQLHGARLLRGTRQPLPPRFAVDVGLASNATPREQLFALGQQQRQQTGAAVNWVGTYENVARCLLRAWELEAI